MSRRGAAGFRPSSFPPAFLTPQFNRLSLQNPIIAQTQTRLIRSIQKPIHKGARFNHDPRKEVLKSSQAAAFARKVKAMPLRPGLLGYKRAMSAIYDAETGIRRPVTIIQLDRNQVVEHKTRRKHGYIAACMGCGAKSFGNLTRPVLGQYAAKGIPPSRDLVEFRVASEAGLPAVGTTINADWFTVGQYIDVKAKCRGMGFEGGMKRHGFRGQDASHGASLSHRSMGSAGQGQGGGSRVLPGKRMPGRMGGQSVNVQNLQVVRTDPENGLLVVAGAIPGPKKALIKISDALKKPWPEVPQAYAHLFATDGKAPAAGADATES